MKLLSKLFVLGLLAFSLGNQLRMKEEWQSAMNLKEGQITALLDELGTIQEEQMAQENVLQNLALNFEDENSKTNEQEIQLSSEEATLQDGSLEILLLGTNGMHTDSILLASLNTDTEEIHLISLPRDLLYKGRRINTYYSNYGAEQMKRIVGELTGLSVEHYAQVDLQGFVEIVDLLGGIDVYVETALMDYSYPDGQGGTTTYSIEKGHHHLDGESALKYARSRHNTSDFDRAARQQKVVEAARFQLGELDKLKNLDELMAIFETGLEYSNTDLSVMEMLSLFHDHQDATLAESLVFSNQNYLERAEGEAYLLMPKNNDYSILVEVVRELVQ